MYIKTYVTYIEDERQKKQREKWPKTRTEGL